MINFNDASVLVLGGSGTFGSALTRFILENQRPARLIVFSRGEHRQAELAAQLKSLNDELGGPLRFFIGDVRDRDRLELAMRGVDYVIHAAALKSIDACEYNPQEAIATNITGTINVIQAAIATDSVRKVIGISTDKAAAPTTLYGTTKLAMERLLSSANALAGGDVPLFASVRYGNVLGSAGSVLPLYRRLLAEQRHQTIKALPLTHLDMARFFWTVRDALVFTLTAMETVRPGEVLMPRLRSVRIADLARALEPECELQITGIRPGEKLYETMLSSDEELTAVDYGDMIGIPPLDGSAPVNEKMWGLHYDSGNPDLMIDDLEVIRELIERHDREAAL